MFKQTIKKHRRQTLERRALFQQTGLSGAKDVRRRPFDYGFRYIPRKRRGTTQPSTILRARCQGKDRPQRRPNRRCSRRPKCYFRKLGLQTHVRLWVTRSKAMLFLADVLDTLSNLARLEREATLASVAT